MRGLVIICCVLYAQAATVPKKCDGKEIGGIYYDKEVLKKGLDRPYQLVVDTKTNTLFFSYSIGKNEEDRFRSAYIDLNTNEVHDITGIENGFANAVDQQNGVVYLGGSNGIYKFDYATKIAKFYKAKDYNIWVLFFKEKLYFIDYPDQTLHELNGEEVTKVPEFVSDDITQFAIDKNGQKFYVNDTGLYGLKKNATFDMAKLYESRIAFRGISLNKEGRAFFCGENGIFTLTEEDTLIQIAEINNAFGLAFDKDDNFIYATDDEFIRLKPSKKKC